MEIDKTITILEDENGYYREIEGTRIDTDCNGDVWFTTTYDVLNSPLSDIEKSYINEFFTIEDPQTYADLYKNFIHDIDGTNIIIKSGIYGKFNNRSEKTTDLEFNMTLSVFGISNITKKPDTSQDF